MRGQLSKRCALILLVVACPADLLCHLLPALAFAPALTSPLFPTLPLAPFPCPIPCPCTCPFPCLRVRSRANGSLAAGSSCNVIAGSVYIASMCPDRPSSVQILRLGDAGENGGEPHGLQQAVAHFDDSLTVGRVDCMRALSPFPLPLQPPFPLPLQPPYNPSCRTSTSCAPHS